MPFPTLKVRHVRSVVSDELRIRDDAAVLPSINNTFSLPALQREFVGTPTLQAAFGTSKNTTSKHTYCGWMFFSLWYDLAIRRLAFRSRHSPVRGRLHWRQEMKRTLRVGWALFLVSSVAPAQQYVISTVAGGAPPPTPMAAVNASIGAPGGVATSANGDVYFISSNNAILKVDRNGILTRVAGNSRAGFSGDGGPAVNAQLFGQEAGTFPGGSQGVAIDNAGNLYFADPYNNRIRKVSAAGIITTVAGSGPCCFGGVNSSSGDGGPATAAQLSFPVGVALDAVGNLYIADRNNQKVRKVSASGIITTVAGNGVCCGFSGDGGAATNAQIYSPGALAVDTLGNLYIADELNQRVRRVSPDGIISTVAGTGVQGYSGDGGLAVNAQLRDPIGVAIDSAGNLYIADSTRIREVSSNGIIGTVAGTGGQGYSGDGGPAISAELNLLSGVTVDNSGNIYIADRQNNRVRKVSNQSGTITTTAGNGTGNYSGDGGPATNSQVSPFGVAVDGVGSLYLADRDNNRVRKVSLGGTITTIAGTGTKGYSGDGGPATSAQLAGPYGVAVDSANNVYIADSSNNRIRKVSPGGIITTVAGTGFQGYSGDGGPATNAQLYLPTGVATDALGNLYIADLTNYRIRKVVPNGIISTVAGNGSSQGTDTGDGGPATSASMSEPFGLAIDGSNNVYIASQLGNRIRKVSLDGIISTVAGTGVQGFSGDGGPATDSRLLGPRGVTVDPSGNIYIADTGNSRIRKVTTNGTITTVGGTGTQAYTGDGGPATSAQMNQPSGLSVDATGNVYVADGNNKAIRVLQPTGPALSIANVINAASNLPGSVSPGEIVVLLGSGLGPAQLTLCPVTSQGNIGTQCGGTTISFNGTPAPIIYTWAMQVAAIVPYSVSSTSTQATVTYQGQTTLPFSVNVATVAPGLFTLDSTGKGQAAAVNEDGSINTAGHPAPIGSYISLFATGEGQTSPTGVDGQPAQVPLPHPLAPVTVTIGGMTVTPQYAGGAPGEVAGLMQINVQIPTGIQTGNAILVTVQIGNASTQAGVTIAVQ